MALISTTLKMDEEISEELKKIWEAINDLKGQNRVTPKYGELKNYEDNISELCRELEVEKNILYTKIRISEENVALIVPIDGKNEADKQLRTTLVLMSIRDSVFGKDLMKSSDIAIALKRLGIKSIANLATNLSKYSEFLISDGKPKSKNFGFRITIPGIVEGKKIIKSMFNGK